MDNEILVEAHEYAKLGGIAEAPTSPTSPAEPHKLDEANHLKYQLLRSLVANADLKLQMYLREVQHAEIEKAKAMHELTLHMKRVAAKHSLDSDTVSVTEDGYLVPRSTMKVVP